ncbi:MAG TPA: riboflavin synthase [Chitinophagaceae bacterium]|nr:riboflavin synthase [Chitinophagaceae bacterium]
MFTGIIESIGTVKQIQAQGTGLLFTLSSPISHELTPDQSVSHDGACLTITAVEKDTHQVVAISETLQKTNLSGLKPGDQVNLERSLTLQQRLDGHLVQGHIDTTGLCLLEMDKNGSREYRIRFPEKFSGLVIEKGSIALNGVSLTVFDVGLDQFSIAGIPYTEEHTTLKLLHPGNEVNLEFDLIGKYVMRAQQTADI